MRFYRIPRKNSALKAFQKLVTMSFHSSKGDSAEFKSLLSEAKNVVFLTGAGCSAESGIPTFRGAGGLWRKYQATELATPEAFAANPSLVWEFYSYRREVVLTKNPNDAHHAIAEFEKRMVSQARNVHVITQNIDGLHQRAGSKNVIELHGILCLLSVDSLFCYIAWYNVHLNLSTICTFVWHQVECQSHMN